MLMVRELVGAFERKARRSRYDLFVRLASQIPRPVTILDVGGSLEYWRTVDIGLLGNVRIILLNIAEQRTTPPFESTVGDARDLSRYADGQFDVVFSNSVIGHVG